jgi:hypothetical protein
MAEPTFVIVHAPLVGPSTWRWVAEALRGRGHDVVVPALHAEGRAPTFASFVDAIAAAVTAEDVVLVGHSGAGVLLPFAAAAARVTRVRYVFVDAGLPPLSGSILDPSPVLETQGIESDFRASLAARVEADGLLPAWHTWWGDTVMRQLVPDDERRGEVIADTPRLPLAYFDTAADVPPAWASDGAAFLLLSDSYRVWAEAAASYGWPVEELLGTHLELVNQPDDVAHAIIRLAAALG